MWIWGLVILLLGLIFGSSMLTFLGLILLIVGAVIVWRSPAGSRRWY